MTAESYIGAHIVLYTLEQAILLHKRDRNAPNYVGYWALFGGMKEEQDGETPERTAVRELSEELTGYKLAPGSFGRLCTVKAVHGSRRPLIHYFQAQLVSEICDLQLGKEGDGFGLFTHNELDFLPLRPPDRLAIERYFQGSDFGYVAASDI